MDNKAVKKLVSQWACRIVEAGKHLNESSGLLLGREKAGQPMSLQDHFGRENISANESAGLF